MFVASFALYPLALAIFREANISRRLIPATIQAGTFTFTMVALPGSPAIQNIIPTNYFGTTAMAAPVLGIIAAVMMFGLSMLWLGHAKKRYEKKGLFFDEQPGKELPSENAEDLPHPLISLIPLVTVLVSYNVLPAIIPVGDFVKANMIIPALLLGNIESKVPPSIENTERWCHKLDYSYTEYKCNCWLWRGNQSSSRLCSAYGCYLFCEYKQSTDCGGNCYLCNNSGDRVILRWINHSNGCHEQ